VEVRRGDLSDASFVRAAVDGVQAVFHVAGLAHVDERQHSWDEFYISNVEVTRRLYAASQTYGVRRFIFVSSIAAIGVGSNARRLTEESLCRPTTSYGKSKLMAEEMLRGLASRGPPDLVIIRPSLVYGERERGNFVRMVRAIGAGRFVLPGAGDVKKSVCYVGNVAHALRLAMTQPAAGGRLYVLSDEPVPTLRQLVEQISDALRAVGVSCRPVATLPRSVVYVAGILGDAGRRLGVSVPLTTDQVCTLVRPVDCNADRIRRELGYAPRVSLGDGIRRAVVWSHQQGLV
jgi:nucleoside-diphosphate-sugar epimerase